jgi:hypothetical protein
MERRGAVSATLRLDEHEAGATGHRLFRSVNARVRELAPDGDGELLDLFCECRDGSCTRVLRMTVGEYDALADAGFYAVLPGHDEQGRDVVIGRCDAYVIVRLDDAA